VELNQTMNNEPGLERRATSYAADTFGNAASPRMDGKTSDVLKIRFRVFDHDQDDEDDFMGSYKVLVGTNDDNSKLHEKVLDKKLVNNQQDKDFDCGKISFRLYFNAVDIWQQYGMRYIDKDHKEREAELLKIEIQDAQPKQMRDAFQM